MKGGPEPECRTSWSRGRRTRPIDVPEAVMNVSQEGLSETSLFFACFCVTRLWPRAAEQHLAGAGARGGAVKTGPLARPQEQP